jgi:6-phosphogluconolactonase
MKNQQLVSHSWWKARLRRSLAVAFLVLWIAPAIASDREGDMPSSGAVYTASNSSSGNEVLAYKREANGNLQFIRSFATGGTGNDDSAALGNQGGIAISRNGQWLLVVNPGSNDFSAFRVAPNGGLTLTDTEPSNGLLPVSVTISGNLLYVVNSGDGDGDTGNIAGFTIDFNSGDLTPILGSIRPLSGMTDPQPAQIQFNRGGTALVVTEKATNFIDTYMVDANGVASEPVSNLSHGVTPFGFSFSKQGYLIVSEAFAGLPDISAVSSYSVNAQGEVNVITPSAPTTETAACWIVVTDDGDFTYATNTGSGTISGYRINRATGELRLLDPDGITATTGVGSGPTDAALIQGSDFLYVLNSLSHEIIGFSVEEEDGSLEQIELVGGLPDFAFGLIAR